MRFAVFLCRGSCPMLFFAVFKRMSVLLRGVFNPPPPPKPLRPPPISTLKLNWDTTRYHRTTSTPRDANWFAHERPKKLSATYTSRLFFSLHLNVPEAYLKLKILSFLYTSLTWISQISDVKLLWSQYVLLLNHYGSCSLEQEVSGFAN